jgi:hypothetical protein
MGYGTREKEPFNEPSLTSKGGSKPIYCNGIEMFLLNLKGEQKGDQHWFFGLSHWQKK